MSKPCPDEELWMTHLVLSSNERLCHLGLVVFQSTVWVMDGDTMCSLRNAACGGWGRILKAHEWEGDGGSR